MPDFLLLLVRLQATLFLSLLQRYLSLVVKPLLFLILNSATIVILSEKIHLLELA